MLRLFNLLTVDLPESARAMLEAILQAAISSGDPGTIASLKALLDAWQ